MSDLEERLRHCDQEVVEKAFSDLSQVPEDQVIHICYRLAAEGDPEYRCCALDAMALVSRERTEALAVRLIADSHEAVREYACNILGELNSAVAVPLLKELAASDSDDLVRNSAYYWLGELGDEAVLPVLELAAESDQGVDHEGTPIRLHALKAIQKIKARGLKH